MILIWLLALLITGPLLARGYVLQADMVFTPRQYLVPDAWGVGSAAPRAVPVDALLAVLTAVVAGEWIQMAVLVAIPVLAGVGTARLLPGRPGAQAIAAGCYLWSPLVAERLLAGHWTYLLAVAALPWLLAGLLDVREAEPGAPWRALLWLGVCSLSPGGGVVALVLGAGVLLVPPVGTRRLVAGLAAWLCLNAPWWLPGLLRGSSPLAPADAVAAVDVFSARADTPLGLLGSLLTSGAIWNADAVPASRASPAWVPVTALLLLLAAAGWRPLREAWGGRSATGVAVAAGAGLLLSAWGAVAPASLATLLVHVPGGGLLRDGQRFVVLWWLLCCPLVGLGAERVAARVRDRAVRRVALAAAALLPLLVLPDLAWGAAGRLAPVDYPSDWARVREVLAREPTRGDVVSAPFQPYRQVAWNDLRAHLDPAPRFLPVTVVVSRDLTVGTTGGLVTVPGDDERARLVGAALDAGDRAALTEAGVGWILVARGTPGALPGWLDEVEVAVEGPDLTLLRLAASRPPEPPGWAGWVLATYLAAGLLLLAAASSLLVSRVRGRVASAEPDRPEAYA